MQLGIGILAIKKRCLKCALSRLGAGLAATETKAKRHLGGFWHMGIPAGTVKSNAFSMSILLSKSAELGTKASLRRVGLLYILKVCGRKTG